MGVHEDIFKIVECDIYKRYFKGELKGRLKSSEIAVDVLKNCQDKKELQLKSSEIAAKERYFSEVINSVMVPLWEWGYVKEGHLDEETLWEIHQYPLRVFGKGKGSVYLFYNPTDCERSDKIWECKIGMTEDMNVRKYVNTKTKNWGWTDDPTIALIFKTDNPRNLENEIHRFLDNCGLRCKEDPYRNWSIEWFYVHPDVVVKVYEHILMKT